MSDTKQTAVGGLDDLLAKINEQKKVARLMGSDDKGRRDIDLPAWFTRKGLRKFEVDTGLGVVSCIVPRATLDVAVEDASEEQIVPLIVRTLVKIPSTWLAEEEMKFGAKGPEIKEGDALPQPSAFYKSDFDAQRDYLSCLPRSLQQQVWIGLSFMALPPLPSDPQPSA